MYLSQGWSYWGMRDMVWGTDWLVDPASRSCQGWQAWRLPVWLHSKAAFWGATWVFFSAFSFLATCMPLAFPSPRAEQRSILYFNQGSVSLHDFQELVYKFCFFCLCSVWIEIGSLNIYIFWRCETFVGYQEILPQNSVKMTCSAPCCVNCNVCMGVGNVVTFRHNCLSSVILFHCWEQ